MNAPRPEAIEERAGLSLRPCDRQQLSEQLEDLGGL
jgi:hypothetical protein